MRLKGGIHDLVGQLRVNLASLGILGTFDHRVSNTKSSNNRAVSGTILHGLRKCMGRDHGRGYKTCGLEEYRENQGA